MNAARLLEHFERISDAADAVPRLRRFVLDLAVRGKLTTQTTKRVTSPEQTSEAENPFPIPADWQWVTLKAICSKTGSGSTPRGGKDAYKPSGVLFLRSQNIYDDGLRLDDVAFIDASTHQRMAGTAVLPGDLLLNITGGSMGRCALVPSEFSDANVSQHVAIIRVDTPGMQGYLHKCILSPYFQSLVLGEQTGAGRGGLPKNKMDRLPIPLPPLDEQKRIVAKVDELMALCDRLEAAQAEREARRDRLVAASLARVSQPAAPDAGSEARAAGFHLDHFARLTTRPEHVKHLRQTILNLAVRGRLVPQDPQNQSATTRSTSSIPDYTLPPSWSCHALAMLLNGDSQNGYSKKPDEAPDGFPILRISAGTTRTDGIVNEEEYKLISGITAAVQNQYSILPGDLLACRFNGNKRFVGRFTLFQGYSGKSFIYPDKLIRLRVNQAMVLPDLLRHFGESDLVRAEVEAFCATTVGNWGISATNLKLVRFPLPPLAEQRRIVAKVDELMTLCDQLEASLAAAATDRARLLESLLHEALAPAA